MQIASPSNREKLVVEILYKNEIIAEINQDGVELEIEIYPPSRGNRLKLPMSEFQKALEKAKQHLIG